MKQCIFNHIAMILFGFISSIILHFIDCPFLFCSIAICCGSYCAVFARMQKEAFALYFIYSVSFIASRYFWIGLDATYVMSYILICGIALVSILYMARPGVKMNALRSLAGLVFNSATKIGGYDRFVNWLFDVCQYEFAG